MAKGGDPVQSIVKRRDVEKLIGKHIYAVRKDGVVVTGLLRGLKGNELILEQPKGKKSQDEAVPAARAVRSARDRHVRSVRSLRLSGRLLRRLPRLFLVKREFETRDAARSPHRRSGPAFFCG